MHITFRQMPIAAAKRIGIWLVLKSPKHSQALKYAEHAYVVMQESGILREMSGGW